MKRTILAWTICAVVFAVPALAQHGNSGPKPSSSHGSQAPKSTTSHGSKAPKPATGGPKATATSGSHGATKVSSGKTTSSPKVTTAASSPKTNKSAKTTTATNANKTPKATKTTSAATPTSLPPPPPGTPLSPAQLKLQKNTNLAAKLQSRLPAGTNLQTAASGFRNLGQFVAAVNVSNNLGIPFTELKTRMVDRNMSLGQAIQDTRPRTTDTTVIVSRAERDADDLIRTTGTAKSKKTGKPTGGEK
jgi:hypothetical protein